MNRNIMLGIGIGVVVAAGAGALAGYGLKRTAAQPDAPLSADLAPQAADTTRPDAAASASGMNGGGSHAGSAHPAASRDRDAQAPASRTPQAAVPEPLYAKVVSSEPIVETERVPRQECTDQQVTRQKPVKDEKRVAGAAIGAVLGGVLGHQVGDGDGQKLATVAGAVAGGYAGSKVQKRIQENNTETVTEKVCKTVYDTKEKKVGYEVTYSVGGETHKQRMANDPGVGAHVPVKDGRLVLNARTGASDRGTT